MNVPANDGVRVDDKRTEWELLWDAHKANDRQERQKRGPLLRSVFRGFLLRCPNCGKGKVMSGFLKPSEACAACGESYAHIRTDDFAPWLSILILGHIFMSSVVAVQLAWAPPLWVQAIVWLSLGVVLTLLILPRAKGIALGIMWTFGLTGSENR